ncbi:MAG: hypothetical protein WC475_01660 [Candidatus Paceibacterota bacterium]|jgi:hypothetical protein
MNRLQEIQNELAQKFYGVDFSKLCCGKYKAVVYAALAQLNDEEEEKNLENHKIDAPACPTSTSMSSP